MLVMHNKTGHFLMKMEYSQVTAAALLHVVNSFVRPVVALCDRYVNRSSRPEVFCKKGILRDFSKLTGKNLCQRLFFNKVVGLQLY